MDSDDDYGMSKVTGVSDPSSPSKTEQEDELIEIDSLNKANSDDDLGMSKATETKKAITEDGLPSSPLDVE
jgi:hypothetical protein